MGRVWLGLVSGTVQQTQTFMVFSVHRQTNTVELRLTQYPYFSIQPFIRLHKILSPNIPQYPPLSFIPPEFLPKLERIA